MFINLQFYIFIIFFLIALQIIFSMIMKNFIIKKIKIMKFLFMI